VYACVWIDFEDKKNESRIRKMLVVN